MSSVLARRRLCGYGLCSYGLYRYGQGGVWYQCWHGAGYVVMAYVVLAYVVMAYVVMAYVVMAYAAMAYVVVAKKAYGISAGTAQVM